MQENRFIRTYLDTEAVEIGIQKGKLEEKRNIARNLMVLGFDKEDIMKATGLKLEDLNKINS